MQKFEPRIPHVNRSEWTDEVRDVFAVLEGAEGWEKGPRFDIISVFAQHPALTRPFLAYNRYILMNSILPARERELVTLYVGWTCKSPYEWLSHVRMGLQIGLTDEDIEAIKQGPNSPHWSDSDRDLLRAVDQMRNAYDLDDGLWASLSKRYNHREMMELLFIIGNYIMFSAVLNALRVPPEAGGDELAKRYGTP
jgi:alkylhydroperoxidase family enzyme